MTGLLEFVLNGESFFGSPSSLFKGCCILTFPVSFD